jgi:hypothetical protein
MAEAAALALWEIGAAWATEAAIFAAANAVYINAAIAITASSAYGAQQKRRAAASARASYAASLKDREVMIRSAIAPRRVIYGRDRVSGPIVYAQSSGDKGQYLHLVIALAGHECDEIETIYFGDVALPDANANGDIVSGEFAKTIKHDARESGSGATLTLLHEPTTILAVTQFVPRVSNGESGGTRWVDVAVDYTISGQVVTPAVQEGLTTVTYEWSDPSGTPYVRVRKHLGGAGQAADAELVAVSDGAWTSEHVGVGVCYLYVRLEYNVEVFGQVGVPNISCVLRGRKIRDPRDGVTRWSDNAALCTASWLRDSDYGLTAMAVEVPDSEVIAAANICDEQVQIGGVLGDAPIYQPVYQSRYVFNGSFASDQSPRDVLADMLSGMAGSCVWSQGRWLVRPGAARTPTVTIGADQLAGGAVQIVPKASRADLFNAVRVTYRDPSQGWAEVQAPLVTNATYEAADGGVRIVRAIQMPGSMDAIRAQRLAKIELERERQALTVQLVGNLATYDLAPTDACYLDLSRYGFANKLMEVRQRTWSPDGTLPYTLRETAAEVWAWNMGEATIVDLAPNTVLPSPYAAPVALSGLSAASGTDHLMRLGDGTVIARALVQWTGSVDAFVRGGGQIELQWKRPSEALWQVSPSIPGDMASAYLQQMPDATLVLIRARQISASGRASDWASITHFVLGKSAPPSDVAGLTAATINGAVLIKWTRSVELDYFRTEVRYGANFDAGTRIIVTPASAYLWPFQGAGTYTLWAAHFDTSGNMSAPVGISIVVSAPTLAGLDSLAGPAILEAAQAQADLAETQAKAYADGIVTPAEARAIAAAQVKADAAQAAAIAAAEANPLLTNSSILIGGRNRYHAGLTIGSIQAAVSSITRSKTGFSFGGNVDNNGVARLYNIFNGNGTYTISFDLSVSQSSGFTMALDFADSASAWSIITTTTTQHFSHTFTISNYTLSTYNFIDFNQLSGQVYTFTNFKVESGNVATDWTPAPEDIDAQLLAISSDFNLSKGEKPAAILEWTKINSDWSSALNQAANFGLSGTAEVAAYSLARQRLENYLNAIDRWGNVSVDTYITPTDWQFYWSNVYAKQALLLDLIARVSGERSTWAGTSGTGKPSDYATSDVTLIASNGITLVGNTATHTTGDNWNRQVYSRDSFTGGAYASGVLADDIGVNSNIFLGLNTAGDLGDANYATIDYAIHNSTYPNLVAYSPSGNRIIGEWRANDVLAVTYDGVTVRWLRNGEIYYFEPAASGIRFYFDSSYGQYATLKNIRFGPMSNNDWSATGGAGKPADNATKNIITYSAYAPTAPVDGDFWIDTTSSPFVIKMRVSGAWQIGANLSTGLLAQLNNVDTSDIATGAVTAVVFDQITGPVTVSSMSHSPDGFAYQTTVASLTLTPAPTLGAVAVDVLVTVIAGYTVQGVGATAYLDAGLHNGTYNGWNRRDVDQADAGKTRLGQVTLTQKFSQIANASVTFKFCSAILNSSDVASFKNIEIRAEVIKR